LADIDSRPVGFLLRHLGAGVKHLFNMSPRPHSSASPPPAEVREKILLAAKAEFARRGFEAASVRDIASAAGATAAMINYYFGGKQKLYQEVVDTAEAELFTQLAQVFTAPVCEPSFAARLVGAYFDFLTRERELQRLLLREMLDNPRSADTTVRRHVEPLRQLFKTHFGDAGADFQAAVSLFGAVAGYFIYAPVLESFLGQDPLSTAALAKRRKHVVTLAESLSIDRPKARQGRRAPKEK